MPYADGCPTLAVGLAVGQPKGGAVATVVATARALVSRTPKPVQGSLSAWTRFLYGLSGVIILVVIWDVVTQFWLTSNSELASPLEVARSLASMARTGEMWVDCLLTLRAWAIGLAISFVIGVPVGLLLGSIETVWQALRPALDFLRSVPGIALMPLALILWGASLRSDIFLVVFGTVWIVIVQATYGVRSVDATALETARSLRLGHVKTILWVMLPSALPYLGTGLRIASTGALTVAVSAELLIGDPGLGNAIGVDQGYSQYTPMYALIVVTGVIGIVAHIATGAIERPLLRWRESQRGDS